MANPVITSNGGGATASTSVAENATLVTTVTATDADTGDTKTFSLGGGADASKFAINGSTGALSFRSPPNFESPTDVGANNTYEVIVVVTDSTGASDTQTITVTVTNVTPVTLDGTTGDDNLGGASVTTEGDTINGLAGDDTINGGIGADTMNGGDGSDTFYVDNTGDTTVESAGQVGDVDTVIASVDYTLAADVENLTLATGTSSIDATGNSDANILTGNAGSNVLNGMGGADEMIGGKGHDTFYVDDAGDVVTEVLDEGTDTVYSSFNDYTLAANVEHLTLTGSAVKGTGNGLANNINGNGLANTLIGGGGGDKLDGKGGIDDMSGGVGGDTYIVDSTFDLITELDGEGVDYVESSADYTLSDFVENLKLTGSLVINGTGNDLNNTLIGNSKNNILNGLDGNDKLSGGIGADTMIGGAGNDTYDVDNAGDAVDESTGSGIDTVNSGIDYGLGGLSGVENLVLTGTNAIDGIGNELDNKITGNNAINQLFGLAGDDTLNGAGGADLMSGGTGNDTYIVDNASDLIDEVDGEGSDTIRSSVDWTIDANVENLILTGSSAIDGTGTSFANEITGNSAANVISGLGGADALAGGKGNDTIGGGSGGDTITGGLGVDTMTGGTGADTFVFNAINDSGTSLTGQDHITDFGSTDIIDLSAIDAKSGVDGNQAFVLDTNGDFKAGEIKITAFGDGVRVWLNTDSDLTAEMTFVVDNVSSLASVDFVL